MNTSDLRKVCGHDSYSVDGCIICEAAELIDYCLKGNNIEQQLQQAREEGRKEAAREILLDTMITTFIAPGGMVHKRLRKKFGLEE